MEELGLDPEEELDNLQNDVKQMADRILHYRRTLPHQLKEGFTALVSDQSSDETEVERRFENGTSSGDDEGNSENSDPVKGTAVYEGEGDDEQPMKMKIQLLKKKTSVNAAAAPFLLKRIKVCVSKIETLDSDHGRTTHPAFWVDRTNQPH